MWYLQELCILIFQFKNQICYRHIKSYLRHNYLLFHHLHIIIITFAILLFYYIVLQHLAKIQNYYAFAMQLIVNLQKTAIPPSQRPLPRHRVNNHSFHIANARASIQTPTANTRKTNQGGKPFPSSPPPSSSIGQYSSLVPIAMRY